MGQLLESVLASFHSGRSTQGSGHGSARPPFRWDMHTAQYTSNTQASVSAFCVGSTYIWLQHIQSYVIHYHAHPPSNGSTDSTISSTNADAMPGICRSVSAKAARRRCSACCPSRLDTLGRSYAISCVATSSRMRTLSIAGMITFSSIISRSTSASSGGRGADACCEGGGGATLSFGGARRTVDQSLPFACGAGGGGAAREADGIAA